MKTRILKKIGQRIRVIYDEDQDMYFVQKRDGFSKKALEANSWENLNQYASHKKALGKKHSYIVMILMRDLGYRREFVKRRTDRKKRHEKIYSKNQKLV